jgi:thiamine biosynthesis lipoprotein
MPTATAADALSTAFSLMPAQDVLRATQALGAGRVYLTNATGRTEAIGA